MEDRELKTWPEKPYRGLAFYQADERGLFSGRSGDERYCIERLTALETRVLLVFGHTGCGKSSFLRAGLIPSLEESSHAFRFVRDDNGATIFIRSGADPLSRIAESVYIFLSNHDVEYPTAAGTQKYDISAALLGHPDFDSYMTACRRSDVMLESLQALSAALPYTLILILDQAEEVITLREQEVQSSQRQFFDFLRDFSSIYLPVKLLVALRSEYSGQFLELASEDGSFVLPGDDLERQTLPTPAGAEAVTTEIKIRPDVKLFYLRELNKREVQNAIVLPTSEKKFPGYQPASPRGRYNFSFGEGVAERIVEDLFTESATAVLPVMQLVCRDLFERVCKKSHTDALRLIDHELYASGDRLAGPVDRHISDALKATFPPSISKAAVEEEVDRWRELLCSFIIRKSGGTVTTDILDFARIESVAAQHNVRAPVRDVLKCISQPDVLLLRCTPSLDGNDTWSLGHDFIGLVLDRWKLARSAQERAAAAAKELSRFRWKVARRSVLGAIIAIVALMTLYFVDDMERNESSYDVLVNKATHLEREDSHGSMLLLAQALKLSSRRFMGPMWNKPDASELLSDLLARRAVRQTDSGQFTVPLRRSGKFLVVRDDTLQLTDGDSVVPIDLSEGEDPSITLRRGTLEASETDFGDILVLRQDYFFAEGTIKYKFRVFAFSVPPASDSSKVTHTGTSTDSSEKTKAELIYSKDLEKEEWVRISDGIIIRYRWNPNANSDPEQATYHLNEVLAYRFNDGKKTVAPVFSEKKFVVNLGSAPNEQTRAIIQGGYAVIPDGSATKFVSYNLKSVQALLERPIPLELPNCPGCFWDLIPVSDPDSKTVLFGARKIGAKSADGTGSNYQSQIESQSGTMSIDAFAELLLLDVAHAKSSSRVAIAEVIQARSKCAIKQGHGDQRVVPIVGSSEKKLFVGILENNSVDVIPFELGAGGAPSASGCQTYLLPSEIAKEQSSSTPQDNVVPQTRQDVGCSAVQKINFGMTLDGKYFLGAATGSWHARWSAKSEDTKEKPPLLQQVCQDTAFSTYFQEVAKTNGFSKLAGLDFPPEFTTQLCK